MEGTYIQEGFRPPSCTLKYLESGSRQSHLRNLWKNLILSMTYTSGLPLRSFYSTSDLAVLVINTSTTFTNLLMGSQSSATLLLNYLINVPFAYNLICPKLQLAMVSLVFPHNHIKVSLFIFPSLGWPLMTVTKILSMKESMVKPAGYLSLIISMGWSMDMQEFPRRLILPGSDISSEIIPLFVMKNTSNWINGLNYSITKM